MLLGSAAADEVEKGDGDDQSKQDISQRILELSVSLFPSPRFNSSAQVIGAWRARAGQTSERIRNQLPPSVPTAEPDMSSRALCCRLSERVDGGVVVIECGSATPTGCCSFFSVSGQLRPPHAAVARSAARGGVDRGGCGLHHHEQALSVHRAGHPRSAHTLQRCTKGCCGPLTALCGVAERVTGCSVASAVGAQRHRRWPGGVHRRHRRGLGFLLL